MVRTALAILFASVLAAGRADAGEFNTKLDIGKPAPTWADLPGVDDKPHSFADFKDKEAIVVVFTCNHCPVAKDYEERLVAFAAKHAGPDSKAAFVAINVSLLEEDKLSHMKERAKKKGFTFPYLYDASQKVGRAYGATVTPEFFILDKQRKVVYMGAMDDHVDPRKVKEHYLVDALTAVLKGTKPPQAETCPNGCTVEYQKAPSK